MNGGPGPIINNPQNLGPSGISPHQGHMNGLGAPGSLSNGPSSGPPPVSYTHLRAHET